jgi:hypothetical protein
VNHQDPTTRDEWAEDLLRRVLHLAVVVRDEGPDARAAALAEITDPAAALVVAAALIDVERPIDRWWEQPPPTGGWSRHCEDCSDPITDRDGPRPVVCEPCRVARRRATWRSKPRSRGRKVAAVAS